MSLQPLEQPLLGSSQELLLLLSITAVDAETKVHTAPDTLVRDDVVDLGILVQNTVEDLGLAVGDLFLTADLLHTISLDEFGHDLAGNPQVEDGECVVQGVILRDGRVVEYDAPR